MLSCASNALGSHLLLQALISRVAPQDARALAHGVTGGIRDLESARPAFALLRVASLARREPDVLAMLQGAQVTRVDDLPDGPARRALADFFRLYGDRAVREAELSTPRWREEPRPVLAMLQVALKGEARTGEDDSSEPVAARGQALAAAEMHRLAGKLGVVQETVLRHLVARGAEGRAHARADARLGDPRARHAARHHARRRPTAAAARPGAVRARREHRGALVPKARLQSHRDGSLSRDSQRVLPHARRGGLGVALGADRSGAAAARATRRERSRSGAAGSADDLHRRAAADGADDGDGDALQGGCPRAPG